MYTASKTARLLDLGISRWATGAVHWASMMGAITQPQPRVSPHISVFGALLPMSDFSLDYVKLSATSDGVCVRFAVLHKASMVVTAHAHGVIAARPLTDLAVPSATYNVAQLLQQDAANNAPVEVYDIIAAPDESWVAVSYGDGATHKVSVLSLPRLQFKDNVVTCTLPARAMAVSPDSTIMYVCVV